MQQLSLSFSLLAGRPSRVSPFRRRLLFRKSASSLSPATTTTTTEKEKRDDSPFRPGRADVTAGNDTVNRRSKISFRFFFAEKKRLSCDCRTAHLSAPSIKRSTLERVEKEAVVDSHYDSFDWFIPSLLAAFYRLQVPI